MADQQIVIFGAGKIGRSFVGQLFGRAGYGVVFVDMDKTLVKRLNRAKQYPVIIKGPDHTEKLVVEKVRAIYAKDHKAVLKAIVRADILAISVGKSALPAIAPVVAKGIQERESYTPGRILDIILAENMRSADHFFREKLREILPPSFPLDERVGLVETSIGKMVPIMTGKDLDEDPLQVFAEPYNTLILDRKGFRGEIPEIGEFALKDNMKAWVDRKAFIHNLGHATAAYCGHLSYPEANFMYQVLADPKVHDFTRKVMLESAQVLISAYPDEFSAETLTAHIDDLLNRFQNSNLGDTVFRVGSDLKRKLGPDDRFMGIIRMANQVDKPCGMIVEAMAMGFCFKSRDENGDPFPGDAEFLQLWKHDPNRVLEQVCRFHGEKDAVYIELLKQNYTRITTE
ncbi:MAG: hypothetical protein KAT15_12085 [Bacteroidales bacterium]|nr:hypothetical protein [Bacteroidales bacterium]